MNYDGLTASYWNEQAQRIEDLRKKVNAQSVVSSARTVPDDESLVIGSGRRLNVAIMFLDISDPSSRFSYAANFASKMLAHAKPGEIVLGERAQYQLPLSWQSQFARLALLLAGWNYILTGTLYPLYRYVGRWS